MNERQTLHIERKKKEERIKKVREKRHKKTDAEMQEEVLMEAKKILGLL
jgi:hypothetical protein